MHASYRDHLSGALRRYESYTINGFVTFDSFRRWDPFGAWGLDGLRQELGLLLAKEEDWGLFSGL
jgi:hypothetical protein